MQIDRLRLVGFKSFVDATELTVGPGLTGIVGPNGCGKSNLVEALRWVMGETSAKRLRGGEMDDVIFAGSAERPARNIAEVALVLDNSARDAPFAFRTPSASPDHLASAMLAARDRRAELPALGRRARRWAMARLTWEAQLAPLEETLTSLAPASANGSPRRSPR